MIRKQYHGRRTDDSFLVWDVRGLVEKAKSIPVIQVPLSEIRELDEPYWYQEGSPEPTCRHIANHCKLVREASLDFPILLCSEGRVMDGMHRVVKAYCDGLIEIPAKKFRETPAPDFIDVGFDELSYDD